MTEPLFWNTLPEAADWLTRHVGIVLNVRSLIDAAITSNGVSRGGFIGTFPTLIRARLPRDANFMAVDENASMDELESPTHKLAVAQYGEPRGLKSAYVYGPVGGTTIPLYASDLTELLLRGSVSIQGREGRQIFWHNGSESEQLTEPGRTISGLTFFVMPMGAEVVITPDDCFIDRADLLKLAAKLNNPADDEYRGTNKRWTDDVKASLAEYRQSHTARETAEKFGIHESRVRRILGSLKTTQTPSAHNPFAAAKKR